MELKRNQQLAKPISANSKETVQKSVQWKNFLIDIKSEFKKIEWTTPEELSTYTKIVVAMTFIFGMGLYGMDLIIQLVLSSLEYVMRLVG